MVRRPSSGVALRRPGRAGHPANGTPAGARRGDRHHARRDCGRCWADHLDGAGDGRAAVVAHRRRRFVARRATPAALGRAGARLAGAAPAARLGRDPRRQGSAAGGTVQRAAPATGARSAAPDPRGDRRAADRPGAPASSGARRRAGLAGATARRSAARRGGQLDRPGGHHIGRAGVGCAVPRRPGPVARGCGSGGGRAAGRAGRARGGRGGPVSTPAGGAGAAGPARDRARCPGAGASEQCPHSSAP